MSLAFRSANDATALAASVRAEVLALDSEQPVHDIKTMQDVVAASVATRRLAMYLFGVFAGFAVLLSAMGIYGVVSHSVAQRRHEIGIRMALGARGGDVSRMITAQSMRLTLVGIVLGAAGALGLAKLMSALLYGVSATDPATFVAVSVLLASVALAASYVPARRATRVDPTVALRSE